MTQSTQESRAKRLKTLLDDQTPEVRTKLRAQIRGLESKAASLEKDDSSYDEVTQELQRLHEHYGINIAHSEINFATLMYSWFIWHSNYTCTCVLCERLLECGVCWNVYVCVRMREFACACVFVCLYV
jgi:hypothetical protein